MFNRRCKSIVASARQGWTARFGYVLMGVVLQPEGANMPLNVSAQIVWAADIADQPGGLAEKLAALANGGANLEFVIARRRPEEPGKGVVFVSPVQGKKAEDAASAAGLSKAMDVPTL